MQMCRTPAQEPLTLEAHSPEVVQPMLALPPKVQFAEQT